MWSDERKVEELSALHIVSLTMIVISLPWDIFLYKIEPTLSFWLVKAFVLVLPYFTWWICHRYNFRKWSQTLIVMSYMFFCVWHTIWIHPAYYITFVELLVVSLLFWRPTRTQFYLQVVVSVIGLSLSMYFAKEFEFTAPGKNARFEIAIDALIFMFYISAYHWFIGRVQERRRQRELQFADLGMRSSYLLHEINRPLNQIVQEGGADSTKESIAELRNLVDALDGVSKGKLDANALVNVEQLLTALNERYREYLADFDVSVTIEGETQFKTHAGALEIVLKNLYLNALEEAARLPQGKRWIKIHLDLIEGVKIVNSLAEPKKVKKYDFFEPGFTTKRGHQGMGLSLSQRLAKTANLDLNAKVLGEEVVFTINARS